ncbi:hypothetical protein HYPSUDRAFT_37738 [Hypholoma sublateritium FD-334 SS-4]|uniref:Fungal-type protein kinase domain-containing protein n=1 Tax=Hypholoma sublateritium (strain FD-334 SS-4) TaxID=945553 RepID=A0A0D2MMU1_HYPSF|nr:hypothetical protein HYPSUDRAFT_37738 [Hypholoma sublateritium FD-334 SS-4]
MLSESDQILVLNAGTQVQVVAHRSMHLLSKYGPRAEDTINTLVVDDILYLCACDRQGIIRSDGISIIDDLPRFLICLLTFHHFNVEDWGVPWVNTGPLDNLNGFEKQPDRNFEEATCPPHDEAMLPWENQYRPDSPGPVIDKERLQCIASQETCAVHEFKLSNAEVQRPPEVDTIRIDRVFLEKSEPSPINDIPKLHVYGGLQADNALHCSALGIWKRGYQTIRMAVLEEFVPLTSETGTSFVNAWLDAVTCHAFLWKHGIGHSDPSTCTVKYHPTRKCGVLTDFDLSAVPWLERAPGTNRAGTIPFMALELLRDEYWEGNIARRYHHELESFIWILPVVFLAYNDGKFDPKTQFIKDWITSDHNTCRLHKLDFMANKLAMAVPKAAFKDYRNMMGNACYLVHDLHVARQRQDDSDLQGYLNDGGISLRALYIEQSDAMYDGFVNVLSKLSIDTTALKKQKPVFDPARNQDLFKEIQAIHKSFPRMCPPHVL